MTKPTLTLIRGVPGSGKSTLAEMLVAGMNDKGYDAIHLEADQYFTFEGKYKYDVSKITEAHQYCYNAANMWLQRGTDTVVSNTFTRQWEIQPYIDLAKQLGCDIQLIECKGQFGNIHNVPDEIVLKMLARWEEIVL